MYGELRGGGFVPGEHAGLDERRLREGTRKPWTGDERRRGVAGERAEVDSFVPTSPQTSDR